MTLGEKQRNFTSMVSLLIQYAYHKGYELSLGDAYRDPRVFGHVGEKKGYGASQSLHKERLAVDLNLFVDGKYITDSNHPAYLDIGSFWEFIGGTWGGRFNDGNHFSVEHNGRK